MLCKIKWDIQSYLIRRTMKSISSGKKRNRSREIEATFRSYTFGILKEDRLYQQFKSHMSYSTHMSYSRTSEMFNECSVLHIMSTVHKLHECNAMNIHDFKDVFCTLSKFLS